MTNLANGLVEGAVQCWTCPIFDALFAIISNVAGATYKRLTIFAVLAFCILFAFYILNIVWKNIKNGGEDSLFQKTLKPVLIKSLIALSLLSAGLLVPRLISTITFEPAALVTLEYAKAMNKPFGEVNISHYTDFVQLSDKTFFTNELRETLIELIETSITNFQVFIKAGITIMDEAFSLSGLLGIGRLIKHIIVFFIGLYLTYNFGKLFIKYSFCFMDIIVAMAMFAFFFPFSMVFFLFKDAKEVPGWMKNLGGNLGSGQIKKLIDAIVSVAATILTYSVIMAIIAGFLDNSSLPANSEETKQLFDFQLDDSNVMEMTLAKATVLVYVINYIADEIPNVTKKILEAFGVKQEDSLSKEMGDNMWKLTTIVAGNAKKFAKIVINPDSTAKADNEKAGDKGKTETKESTGTKDKKEESK